MIEKFYKIAQPDGWDFYTGETINYRDNIGKAVRRKNTDKMELCSPTVIHASRNPNQCFIGGGISCSLFLVEGKSYLEDKHKCGFKQLRVLEELNPEKIFKWRYKEACNPVNPFKIKPPKITDKHIKLLKQWASVRNSVRNSVWNSVRNSVWNSVRNSVWDLILDSVRDLAWYSVGDLAWDSVGDLVWVYVGYIFEPVIKKWKYIDHEPGKYPFQPAVDLWKMGLVSSFDGKKWRLHGGEKADILWEGK